MVDNSVRELNELNSKALSQVDVPRNGHISVKGDVRYVNGVPEVRVMKSDVRQTERAETIRLPHISQPAPQKKSVSAVGPQVKRLSSSSNHKSKDLTALNAKEPVFRIQASNVLEARNEVFGLNSRYLLSNYDKSGWQLAAPIREEELHAPVIAP